MKGHLISIRQFLLLVTPQVWLAGGPNYQPSSDKKFKQTQNYSALREERYEGLWGESVEDVLSEQFREYYKLFSWLLSILQSEWRLSHVPHLSDERSRQEGEEGEDVGQENQEPLHRQVGGERGGGGETEDSVEQEQRGALHRYRGERVRRLNLVLVYQQLNFLKWSTASRATSESAWVWLEPVIAEGQAEHQELVQLDGQQEQQTEHLQQVEVSPLQNAAPVKWRWRALFYNLFQFWILYHSNTSQYYLSSEPDFQHGIVRPREEGDSPTVSYFSYLLLLYSTIALLIIIVALAFIFLWR